MYTINNTYFNLVNQRIWKWSYLRAPKSNATSCIAETGKKFHEACVLEYLEFCGVKGTGETGDLSFHNSLTRHLFLIYWR